jgi:hypothetical protein
MSDNCKTLFPSHIKHGDVLKVIAKVAGATWTHHSFDNKKFDSELPASNDNPWHINFTNDTVKAEHGSSIGMVRFSFQDCVEQRYDWIYYIELSDNNDEKQLCPGSYGFSVAIAKRLVDFFGGEARFFDNDEEYPERYYRNNNPKMPHIIQQAEVNERWYAFYNLLKNEPMLSYLELKEACDAYGTTQKDKKLLDYLKTYELYQAIEQNIEQKYGENNESLTLNQTQNKGFKI